MESSEKWSKIITKTPSIHTSHLLQHAWPLLRDVGFKGQRSSLNIGPIEAGSTFEKVGIEGDAVGDLRGCCCAVLVPELQSWTY